MNYKLWLAILATLLFSVSGKAEPYISSFSPKYASVADGLQINITGSGFTSGAVVRFRGVLATSFFQNSTLIYAFLPATITPGPAPITVTQGGVTASNQTAFIVLSAAPYIEYFYPNVGAGGTTVTNIGAHLSAAGIATYFRFNGMLATDVLNPGQLANLRVHAPAGVTTGPISVYTSAGSYTTAQYFYVTPVITSVTPGRGRAGTNVFVRGVNFTDASSVTFGGVPGTSLYVSNNNALYVNVPSTALTGTINVFAPAGTTYTNFFIEPTLSGFTPNNGPAGTAVTVTGSAFYTGGVTVRFGGVTAPTVSNLTATSFIVGVPAAATNCYLSVTSLDGSGAHTNWQMFYVPARITRLSSTNATSGNIQIGGTNFIGTSAVTFYGTSPTAFTNATDNLTMSVPVPAGVITGPISITTPAGTTNSGSLVFCGVPVINNISPASGQVNTLVTLTGTNFLYATAVSFNGTNATYWGVTNSGMIVAKVPANATSGPITVTGPAGTATNGTFTVEHYSDLAISMTDSPDPVFIGSNLFYTITITNKGPEAAPNVMLTCSLPSIVTNLGTLNSGGKTIVTLKTVPGAVGSITSTASTTNYNTDPIMADNSASVSTVVWPFPVLNIARQGADQFRLTWPAPLSNFTVQYTSWFARTSVWSVIASKPVISNNLSVLIQTNAGTNAFYRLKN